MLDDENLRRRLRNLKADIIFQRSIGKNYLGWDGARQEFYRCLVSSKTKHVINLEYWKARAFFY